MALTGHRSSLRLLPLIFSYMDISARASTKGYVQTGARRCLGTKSEASDPGHADSR